MCFTVMSSPPADLQRKSRETEQTQHDQPAEGFTNSQPFTSGFFDKDAITSKARAEYFKLSISGAFAISVAIWAVLSIYWGALWKTNDFIHNLKGWVVVRASNLRCLLMEADISR